MSMNAFQLDNIRKMNNIFDSQFAFHEGQGVECVFTFYNAKYHDNNNFNDILIYSNKEC
jgi:hypothetical protein